MAVLTSTARGQITFRREFFQHLGLEPGSRVDVQKLPDGSLHVKAAKATGSIDDFIGCLKGKSKKKLTIEQMNKIIADGWAGKL